MNKQLTSKSFGKNAYYKNQFKSQSNKLPTNYKSAMGNMIKHATNQTHHRFELESGDITAGRQNYELFMERVKSKQLSELVNNQLTKPSDPDDLASIDTFYEEFNLGEKPTDLDVDRFWYEYVSERVENPLLRYDLIHQKPWKLSMHMLMITCQ